MTAQAQLGELMKYYDEEKSKWDKMKPEDRKGLPPQFRGRTIVGGISTKYVLRTSSLPREGLPDSWKSSATPSGSQSPRWPTRGRQRRVKLEE